MLIGALTGPWGAPWILTNAEGHALPPLVMSVVIGAGAGLCSQGIFDVYTRWVKTLVKAPET